jgi:two-component system sensor histidine kinase BaeS
MPEPGRFGTLQPRLVAAFAAVAAAAIGVFAALTLWTSRGDVTDLVRKQRQATARDVAATLAGAYRAAGGWAAADLRAARAVAVAGGATLEVRDSSGATVFVPGQGLGRGPQSGRGPGAASELTGPSSSRQVVVAGKAVGTAVLHFPRDALPPAERQLRDALTRTTVIGIGIAAAVALVAGALVAGWIRRPLRRLIAAVGRIEAGDRGARANLVAPGELGELADAVDRMAASLEREDALRTALVSDVAHELRTPVTILQAECEAMLDGVSEPSSAKISSLHDEVLRLGRVVEDLEALASAEAAGLRLERRTVDLAAVAGEVVELLSAQFAAAGIELTRRLEPVELQGDATRLGQVVRNLLTNALKFTPAGGRVEILVERRDGRARCVVSDTGSGIPPDDLPHVFERFWRGSGARGTAGSGIGLAVVDELVRAHLGEVSAASPPSGGSVFTVSLPLS